MTDTIIEIKRGLWLRETPSSPALLLVETVRDGVDEEAAKRDALALASDENRPGAYAWVGSLGADPHRKKVAKRTFAIGTSAPAARASYRASARRPHPKTEGSYPNDWGVTTGPETAAV